MVSTGALEELHGSREVNVLLLSHLRVTRGLDVTSKLGEAMTLVLPPDIPDP